jgi:putative two-component system response regulator
MSPNEEHLKAKILIVDDLIDNVLLLEGILIEAGYIFIQSITDPRETVRVYQEFKPDIVLLDLNMPHMSGMEVLKQLHEIEQETYPSVMILTAQTDHQSKLNALEAGAQDFISKPFDLMEITLRIKKMLEIKVLNKQLQAHNQSLEELVDLRTKELQETRMEAIHRLGRAAEYRDNETGMHVIRMSRYAARLAHEIGLSKEECDIILQASPMHDLGKIGIPDSVLLKPAGLDKDEWKVMQSHSEIGAKILSRGKNKLTKKARIIAQYHHEKWDGTGYPNGISGTKIPLDARIVAIADCFDALTSSRPYKKAWSVEDTMNEMDNSSGTQFDPALMGSFQKILPDILKIKENIPDQDRRKESLPVGVVKLQPSPSVTSVQG